VRAVVESSLVGGPDSTGARAAVLFAEQP